MLAAAVLVCLIPSNQSLWIDESTTALYARTPTMTAFVERIAADAHSDAQMPLGNLYYRIGSRITGTSEVGLRFLSALWILVGALILWRTGLHMKIPFLPLLFTCHAFVWYYGGEVRPYAMQIGLSTALVYALAMLNTQEGASRGVTALAVSGPLLCGATMLAAVPVGVVVVVSIIMLTQRSWSPRQRDWVKIIIASALLILLGAYYGWTLIVGKGAQTFIEWGVGLKNLVLSGYELLGFTGFGPGRYELRELALSGDITASLKGFAGPAAIGIVVLVALYLWSAVILMRKTRQGLCENVQTGMLLCLVVFASTVILIVLSLIADFPFWGRHLAPLFPFVIAVVAIASDPEDADHGIRRALPVILCATLLCSSLILRFSPSHFRDDYRSAGRVARSSLESGATVWWSASIPPAIYYGVPLCDRAAPHPKGCVVVALNLEEDQVAALPSPDVILLSKPDLHDQAGAVLGFVDKHKILLSQEFMAFRVFDRRSDLADGN